MLDEIESTEIAVDQLTSPSSLMPEGASVSGAIGARFAFRALDDGGHENVVPIVRIFARWIAYGLFVAFGAAQIQAREVESGARATRARGAVAQQAGISAVSFTD